MPRVRALCPAGARMDRRYARRRVPAREAAASNASLMQASAAGNAIAVANCRKAWFKGVMTPRVEAFVAVGGHKQLSVSIVAPKAPVEA